MVTCGYCQCKPPQDNSFGYIEIVGYAFCEL